MTNKLNSINNIYENGAYKHLLVCASGRSDLDLIKRADLSICLASSPEYVKEKCDVIINGDSTNLVRLINKIYHSSNVSKTIEEMKKSS